MSNYTIVAGVKRHNTKWTLVLLTKGITRLYNTEEECKAAALYYGEYTPVSIRAPVYA